ncbi:hydroxyacid dehydrogenase [Agromyces sp. SYSU K20354]|uniref:hydroxyacid dehydrogenase n=1 Tax=Agromyces cavernae TaxID=2898659 RepID=UPI001E33C928|nr:hydroxyacid dehydrogenase [Agromyces cavernae]MCD2443434.1 hydroxyacid dehydrogenase [Agromyces cavernae]
MRPKAVFAMSPGSLVGQLFTAEMLAELQALADIDPGVVVTELDDAGRAALEGAEIVLGGWGAPRIAVEDAPALRALVYLGGVAVTCLDTPERWAERGLLAANARTVNAIPVAEYALAMILLAGKDAFAVEHRYREQRALPDREHELTGIGNYRRTVGVVGLSQIAQVLIELLKPFDLDIVAFSPSLTPARAEGLGVRMASLDEVMATSDVVSLHQAVTPATIGQIDARLLASMRDGATLLNTARGAVVDQDALVRELRTGRIRAILDVTEPEPLPRDHELWSLPNVTLTPHLAGSIGTELHRMGANAVAEVRRFVEGAPFEYPEQIGGRR